MPHISVMLYPGRSDAQKRQMAEALRSSLMAAGNWNASDISVSFESVEPEKFSEEVFHKVSPDDLILKSDYIE